MYRRYYCLVSVFLLLLATAPQAQAQLFKKKNKDKTATEETTAGTDSSQTTETKERKILGIFRKKDKDAAAKTDHSLDQGLQQALGSDEQSLKMLEQDPRAQQTAANLYDYQQKYQQLMENGDYEKALDYLKRFKAAQDSLLEIKTEKENALRQAEKSKLEAARERAEAERQRIFTLAMLLGLVLALGLAASVIYMLVVKRRSHRELQQQHDALEQANEEITQQQKLLDEQHTEILQSINYARRIQMAILPTIQHVHAAFADAFIFYRPKDIVSGDFFWFHRTQHRIYLAAVDCTGHGVPGAFMSVLGMSLLNQIVNDDPTLEPAEVLNRLHQGVIQSLKQQEAGASQQDGMDIALVVLDKSTRMLHYAGAHNPMYLMHKGQLETLEADKSPIGGWRYADHKFSNQTVHLQPGDSFYLFSDGLADQFGGQQGRKFSYRRLRELINAHHNQPMASVGRTLEEAFVQWKGDIEQLDDVLVMGVRVA